MKQKTQTKKAFTLVELIVVITILAILGTIAFIALQGYSKSARDSRRISDVQNIKKAIELYQIQSSRYPEPSYSTGITYLGEEVRRQGTVGESVISNVSKTLNKIPLDPLTSTEYTYSVLNTGLEYEIGLIRETNNELSKNILFPTYAEDKIAYITGNYNGQIATVKVGNIEYILAVPSIINSDIGVTDYVEIIAQKTIVYDGYNNLPYSYNGEEGGFDFTPGNIVVYSGSLEDLEINEVLRVNFIKSLQEAYNGTPIVNDDTGIGEIVEKEIDISNPTTEVRQLAIDVLVAWLKLNIGEGQYPEPNSCSLDGVTINHGDSLTAYQYDVILWDTEETCAGTSITRTCTEGVLSGEDIYNQTTCFKGIPLNCDAKTQDGYSISYLDHDGTSSINKVVEVSYGDITYSATAQCNNGTISIYGETDNLVCDSTYHIEYSESEEKNVCVSDTRTCDTIANGSGEQYWSGSSWSVCTLISCDTDYHENPDLEGTCISNTQTVSCGGSIVSNASASTATTYTQTWNGTTWTPITIWGESQVTCDFNCNTNYTWDGDSCEANIQSCTISNGTGTQIWNGSSWETCQVVTCNTDYYNPGNNTCTAVGIGYYSDSTSTNRIACSTSPADNTSRDYSYTSDGNGTNSCTYTYSAKCGIDYYESTNGTCSAVGTGYYSPNLNNTRYVCSTSPADNTSRDYSYTSDGNGTNSCTYTYIAKCGIDYYESTNGTCSAVGTGYYSPNLNNTRNACSTSPADNNSRNYFYTSDGNGTNSCSYSYSAKCGIDYYESTNGTCSAVGTGYYSPNLNNTRYACTNKPTNSTYSSDGNGTNNCSYTCTSGYYGTNCDLLTYQGMGLCNEPDITIGGITIAACNVGTTIAGTATNDLNGFGDFFQFGRNSSYEDGTWTNGSSSYNEDWKSPGGIDAGSANYWGVTQSVSATATYANSSITNQSKMQGPCPTGYHVPTNKEWVDILTAAGITDRVTAYSELKLTAAGLRTWDNGSLGNQYLYGYYWSSGPSSTYGYYGYSLRFSPTHITMSATYQRAYGFSIRCFRN